MKINIQAKNLTLTPAIRNFIREKIGSLEKFIEVRDGLFESPTGKKRVPVIAWVEVGKTTQHHRKGLIFRAECQIELPKYNLRAEAVSERLRSAVVEVKNELQRELKKQKGRMISKRRKAGEE